MGTPTCRPSGGCPGWRRRRSSSATSKPWTAGRWTWRRGRSCAGRSSGRASSGSTRRPGRSSSSTCSVTATSKPPPRITVGWSPTAATSRTITSCRAPRPSGLTGSFATGWKVPECRSRTARASGGSGSRRSTFALPNHWRWRTGTSSTRTASRKSPPSTRWR